MYSLLRTRQEQAQDAALGARWRTTLLGAALVLPGLVACQDHEPPAPEPATPQPDLEPTDLEGNVLDPLASPEAPVAVLVFVSTHCPISNRYAPTLRSIHDTYAARGVAFYLVYPDPADDAAAIRAHTAEFTLPGVAVRDPGHALVAAAKARVTPEVAIFVAEGKRQRLAYHGRIDDRAREFGKVRAEPTARDLVDSLDAVLDARPVPQPETKAVGCYIVDLN